MLAKHEHHRLPHTLTRQPTALLGVAGCAGMLCGGQPVCNTHKAHSRPARYHTLVKTTLLTTSLAGHCKLLTMSSAQTRAQKNCAPKLHRGPVMMMHTLSPVNGLDCHLCMHGKQLLLTRVLGAPHRQAQLAAVLGAATPMLGCSCTRLACLALAVAPEPRAGGTAGQAAACAVVGAAADARVVAASVPCAPACAAAAAAGRAGGQQPAAAACEAALTGPAVLAPGASRQTLLVRPAALAPGVSRQTLVLLTARSLLLRLLPGCCLACGWPPGRQTRGA